MRYPKTFSDHIQRAKLTWRSPAMPPLVDKITAKEIVARKLGEEWVIPSLFAGDGLPPREDREWKPPFVIKANHGSGFNLFVHGLDEPNWPEIERVCSRWLKRRYPRYSGEWPYQGIEPRLLVEPYIGQSGVPPLDYKFFVFGGRVEFVQVDTDRLTAHKRTLFDREWKRLPFGIEYPLETRPIIRPACLANMIRGAELLAEGFPFVRVDLYEVSGQPKFGEMTFFPGSGNERFHPPKYDRIVGQLWMSGN